MIKKLLVSAMCILLSERTLGQDATGMSARPPAPPPRENVEQQVAAARTKLWKSQAYGIQLLVPATWKQLTPNESEIVSFAAPNKEIVSIRAYRGLLFGSADDARQRLEAGLRNQFPKMKVVSSRVVAVNGIETADIVLSGLIGTSSGIYRGISFHNETNSFIMTCFYLPKDEKLFGEVVNSVLGTVSFN
ncbi:hypothetical protein [Flaviaesturariibacter amylovorans]|uniref:Uncharacterized protein n=1 Tax=Flaviaesturariibacter amylovorans TaxID=1084520 RepID=A0ABP8G825_9BACT